jgi:L-amino acid N-acyltransferase YncA
VELDVETRPEAEAPKGAPKRRTGEKLSWRIVTRTSDNLESLLDLAEAGHAESRFGDLPFSRDKARKQLMNALENDSRYLVAVAELNGKVEGFVAASAGEYWIATGALIVTVNTIYTSRHLRTSLLGGRAAVVLFRGVAKWAKGIGAREILVHVTGGIDETRAGRTMKRLGFREVGGSYVAKIV